APDRSDAPFLLQISREDGLRHRNPATQGPWLHARLAVECSLNFVRLEMHLASLSRRPASCGLSIRRKQEAPIEKRTAKSIITKPIIVARCMGGSPVVDRRGDLQRGRPE